MIILKNEHILGCYIPREIKMNHTLKLIYQLQGANELFRRLLVHQFNTILLSLPPLSDPVEELLAGTNILASKFTDLSEKQIPASYRALINEQITALENLIFEISDKAGDVDDFEWWEDIQEQMSSRTIQVKKLLRSISIDLEK